MHTDYSSKIESENQEQFSYSSSQQEESRTTEKAWQESAESLAIITLDRLALRQDQYGKYKIGGGKRSFAPLTKKVLVDHYAGNGHRVGLYTTLNTNDLTTFTVFDFDNHGNENEVIKINHDKAQFLITAAGKDMHPILQDDGCGSLKLWFVWNTPIAAAIARRYGHWLLNKAGVTGVEVFPKQDSVRGRFGNFVRLPGKHHKRLNCWSNFWCRGVWKGKAIAAKYLLRLLKGDGICDHALIPNEVKEFKLSPPPIHPSSVFKEVSHDWMHEYSGDLRTLNVLDVLDDFNFLVRELKEEGQYEIVCPWFSEHKSGDSVAAVWVKENKIFGYHCFHEHCRGKHAGHVLKALGGPEVVDQYCSKKYWSPGRAEEKVRNMARFNQDERKEDQPPQMQQQEFTVKITDIGDGLPSTSSLGGYLRKNLHLRLSEDERLKREKTLLTLEKLIPDTGFFPAYMKYALPSTDAPAIFHLASALVLASIFLNKRAWIKVGGEVSFPVIWAALINESGAGKSSGIDPASILLADDSDYRFSVLSNNFSAEALVEEFGVVVENNNDIAAIQKLKECPLKGVKIALIDELGTFLSMLNKTYNQGIKSSITEWFNCPSFWHKNLKDKKWVLERPFLSMVAASTPSWFIDNSTEGDLQGGFFPRWLIIRGSKDYTLPIRDKCSPQEQYQVTQEIYKLKSASGQFQINEAHPAFDYYWDWAKTFSLTTKKWERRLIHYAQKIALIFQASTEPDNSIISLQNIQLACRLVEYIAVDVATVISSDLVFDKNQQHLLKVLLIIKNNCPLDGYIQHSKALHSSHLAADVFKKIITTLLETNCIEIKEHIADNYKKTIYYKFIQDL